MSEEPIAGTAGREETRERLPHYAILDALRFVLALWVTIGHYGVFPG